MVLKITRESTSLLDEVDDNTDRYLKPEPVAQKDETAAGCQ